MCDRCVCVTGSTSNAGHVLLSPVPGTVTWQGLSPSSGLTVPVLVCGSPGTDSAQCETRPQGWNGIRVLYHGASLGRGMAQPGTARHSLAQLSTAWHSSAQLSSAQPSPAQQFPWSGTVTVTVLLWLCRAGAGTALAGWTQPCCHPAWVSPAVTLLSALLGGAGTPLPLGFTTPAPWSCCHGHRVTPWCHPSAGTDLEVLLCPPGHPGVLLQHTRVPEWHGVVTRWHRVVTGRHSGQLATGTLLPVPSE